MSERGFVTSSEDGNVGLDFPVRTTDTLRERSRAPAITGLCAIRKALDMIALTDTATTKVAELIKAEGEDGLALRVAVRAGGCSGFSYEMFFDSEFADDDKEEDLSWFDAEGTGASGGLSCLCGGEGNRSPSGETGGGN